MSKTMRVRISTPRGELVREQIVHLRFGSDDGWRGVLPGHEPARAALIEGPIALRDVAGEQRWIASEAGVVAIDRDEVRILTTWAIDASTLAELREAVELRDRARIEIEAEARALAHRHELATRRALIALERKVGLP